MFGRIAEVRDLRRAGVFPTLGNYVEIASNLPTNLRLFFALVEQQPPGYDPQVCTCT